MSTREKLDRALDELRKRGHDVGDQAIVAPNGTQVISVDGTLWTHNQIYYEVEEALGPDY